MQRMRSFADRPTMCGCASHNPSSSDVFKIFVGLCSTVANVSGIIAVFLPSAILGFWSDVIIAVLTVNVILALLVIIDDCVNRKLLVNTWICCQMLGLLMLGYLVWQNPQLCLVVSLIVAKISWMTAVMFTIVQSPDGNKPSDVMVVAPIQIARLKDAVDSPPPAYDDLMLDVTLAKTSDDIEAPPPSYDEI